MPIVKIFVGFSIMIGVSGCLSTLFGTKDSKSGPYEFPAPGEGWELIDPGEADSAYRNKQDEAILNISSSCGEGRFQSLENLAGVILRQLPDQEQVEAPKSTTIGGYPGLIMEARGTIDGKKLQVRLAVVRTSTCLFDIILAGNKLDPSSRMAFERSVNGFRERSIP